VWSAYSAAEESVDRTRRKTSVRHSTVKWMGLNPPWVSSFVGGNILAVLACVANLVALNTKSTTAVTDASIDLHIPSKWLCMSVTVNLGIRDVESSYFVRGTACCDLCALAS